MTDSERAALEMIGRVFGRLTVVGGPMRGNRRFTWKCACACGSETEVAGTKLRVGHTRSCGCLQREAVRAQGKNNATHGLTHSPTYYTWSSMKERCQNANHDAYYRYGGRGITVDPRWEDFSAFLADMGERPADRTLDRIDNDKGYCRENCRWATRKEQSANRRCVARSHVQGVPT